MEDYVGTEIAIVGMSGQFPNADDVESFWANLCEGISALSWLGDFQQPEESEEGWHVPAAYLLNQLDVFDEKFFGMSPKEASITDPQQRLLLQCAYQALVNAGYAKQDDDNLTGVFVSTGPSQYLLSHLSCNTRIRQSMSAMQLLIANDKDYAATRISYKLNLKGPSVVAQSACSSSLLCVHLACQSLLAGESNLALAGGFSLELTAEDGYDYTPGSILSKDGLCRPFDESASGTVRGNGGGIVVLKRLDDALQDNDIIWAVIRGSAMNNDGANKVGFSAPSIDGQADVIRTAQQMANVSAQSIGYIETHGTATALGDPIEIEALNQVFSESGATGHCHIGSVKSSIGHLDAGAGVAGLIKTALSLHQGVIPATLHFNRENPATRLAETPFQVVAKTEQWQDPVRRAGISSFGIGGTNVHLVLEQSPKHSQITHKVNDKYLRFSSHSLPALTLMAQRLGDYLQNRPDIPFTQVLQTLQATQSVGAFRLSLKADNCNDAIAQLASDSALWNVGDRPEHKPKVVLMFPGQGTPFSGMASAYYHHSPVYRHHFDSIAAEVSCHSDIDLADIIYGANDATDALAQTCIAQPALFAVEYALAQHWMAHGLNVEAFIGHSIGEYVAATLAGVFSLDEAVRLVVARGRIMQQAPAGDMLAVVMDESALRAQLPNTVSIAAVNRPDLTVVAGRSDHIASLKSDLQSHDIVCKDIPTSHAFHSSMMETCLDEFKVVLSGVERHAPKIPFMSNLTGSWITDVQACDPEYWAQHLRKTVRFIDGIESIVTDGPALFIECGPGTSLSASVNSVTSSHGFARTIAMLPKQGSDVLSVNEERVKQLLWCHGVNTLDDSQLATFTPVLLPAYRFEENQHWIQPDSVMTTLESSAVVDQNEGLPDPAEQTTLEGKLSALWCEALGLQVVDPDANFFDLGGDSILSIQISAKAKRLGFGLSTNDLLTYPTVNQLVTFLDAQEESSTSENIDVSKEVETAFQPDADAALQPFPLTDIQHAYWIGRNAGANSGQVAAYAYEEFECDQLNVERLQWALDRVIARHDMLRAVVDDDGQQRILPTVPSYMITVNDLTMQTPVQARAALESHRSAKSHQILDASQWPLFDMSVTRLPDGSARLHIGFDLLILDAWSITLFWQELEARYLEADKEWPELPIRFRDYVLAENRMMQSASFQAAKDYWLRRLDLFPRAPVLPTLCDADSLEHHQFRRQETVINKSIWRRLKENGASLGLTPSTLLSTAYAEILALWSETPHFCLNLPAFNRMDVDPAIDQLIGDFTSVLLFEMDFRQRESFEQRAKRHQTQLWQDIEALQYSGVKFLHELSEHYGERITVPFVFTSLIFPAADEKNIISRLGRLVNGISQTPHVWLDCQVYEDDGHLVINWDSVDGLFDTDMLENMFLDYRALLVRLADAAEFWQDPAWQTSWLARYTQGGIADANRTHQVLHETTLHQAVLEQCQKTPSAPALLGQTNVTYQQLDNASAYIAQLLATGGTKAGDCVAVIMPKGWQQTVACLSILRTGAAYIPLAVDTPAQRLAYIFEQANIKAVLTLPELLDVVSWPAGVKKAAIDTSMLSQLCDWQDPIISPESTAYIIYTSGTTGNPKGVVITHGAVNNTIRDINHRFSLTADDRTLAVSSLSFDLSVYDIFGPLSVGGAVVLPDARLERDPAHWQQCMEQHQVTIWNTVPALMDMLVNHLGSVTHSCTSHLRLVMMSGDWIPLVLPDRIHSVFPNARRISLGGATEASIWSIFHEITHVNAQWKSIPYGKALANQTMWVLDAHMRARPIGVVGDLYIGGVGLAQGYLNNPEETTYRFVTHPETGDRLYRTGDLGRYLPDGSIEFLGREDNQVKVNGYRVETTEIDKRVSDYPAVNAAITRAFEQQGGFQLVTYVCPAESLNPDQLRAYLAEFLPEYMMPAHILLVDTLPLSANGKVDLKQLPEPEWATDNASKRAPETETERRILAMVESLLERSIFSIDEDLFRLGMDSRQLTNLVTQIRAQLQPGFPLRVAFESPTIMNIAHAVDVRQESNESQQASKSIMAIASDAVRPLASAQQRLWFHDQLHPNSSTYNLVDPFHFSGQLDVACLKQAFTHFVARHDILRSCIESDPEPMMQVLPDHVVDFVELSPDFASAEEADRYVKDIIETEANQSMPMATGELFRVRLIRKQPEEHVLVVTAHHIIWDGWSSAIMIREVSETYRTLISGETTSLIPPALQFHDLSVWEQQQAQSPLFQKQLSYWKQQLSENLPTLALPTEGDANGNREGGQRHAFELDRTLTERFEHFCQQQGVTTFMGYMTLWQCVLSWWCHQDDLVVGTPAGHRADPQLTEMIGFIVNSLAIRQRMHAGETVAEVFKRTKTICLDAYANQDVPFDQVVQAIQPKRSLQESAPIYRTWFVLHDVPMPNWSLPGVKDTLMDAHFLLDVHDLKLSLVAKDSGMEGGLDYRCSLFSNETIHHLSETFKHLTTWVVQQPAEVTIQQLRAELTQVWSSLERSKRENAALPKWDFSVSRRSSIRKSHGSK